MQYTIANYHVKQSCSTEGVNRRLYPTYTLQSSTYRLLNCATTSFNIYKDNEAYWHHRPRVHDPEIVSNVRTTDKVVYAVVLHSLSFIELCHERCALCMHRCGTSAPPTRCTTVIARTNREISSPVWSLVQSEIAFLKSLDPRNMDLPFWQA